jgi:hypothetical protein
MTDTNVSTTPSNLLTSAGALAASATRSYCVLVKLATSAPIGMMGKTTALTFTFSAQQ